MKFKSVLYFISLLRLHIIKTFHIFWNIRFGWCGQDSSEIVCAVYRRQYQLATYLLVQLGLAHHHHRVQNHQNLFEFQMIRPSVDKKHVLKKVAKQITIIAVSHSGHKHPEYYFYISASYRVSWRKRFIDYMPEVVRFPYLHQSTAPLSTICCPSTPLAHPQLQ